MSDPLRAGPPDLEPTWGRVQVYLDRLFDALQELDEAGGVPVVARAQGWEPAKLDKAARSLKAVRGQLDAELAKIRASRDDKKG